MPVFLINSIRDRVQLHILTGAGAHWRTAITNSLISKETKMRQQNAACAGTARAFFGRALPSLTLSALLAFTSVAYAEISPSGIWKTIDDKTGNPKALIEITERDGVYSGKVIKTIKASGEAKKLCTACKDARKDQPIVGMAILTGLKKNGEEYAGGE